MMSQERSVNHLTTSQYLSMPGEWLSGTTMITSLLFALGSAVFLGARIAARREQNSPYRHILTALFIQVNLVLSISTFIFAKYFSEGGDVLERLSVVILSLTALLFVCEIQAPRLEAIGLEASSCTSRWHRYALVGVTYILTQFPLFVTPPTVDIVWNGSLLGKWLGAGILFGVTFISVFELGMMYIIMKNDSTKLSGETKRALGHFNAAFLAIAFLSLLAIPGAVAFLIRRDRYVLSGASTVAALLFIRSLENLYSIWVSLVSLQLTLSCWFSLYLPHDSISEDDVMGRSTLTLERKLADSNEFEKSVIDIRFV